MSDNLLEQFRKFDQGDKNIEGEANLEQQSLNSHDINEFIRNKGLTSENFEQRFNVSMAVDYLQRDRNNRSPLEGEERMHEILTGAVAYIQQKKLPGNLLEGLPEQAHSNIHHELGQINELDQEYQLQTAYETYQTVRFQVQKHMKVQEQFKKIRESKKVEVEGEDIEDMFSDMYHEARKNWRKMSGKEKTITGLAVLAGAIWLMSSSEDNERVAKLKEKIWTGIKITAALYAVNIGAKVFTGKTLLDTLDEGTKETAERSDFFPQAFNSMNEPEKAYKLRDSIAYFGDKDFMYLAEQYRLAKASGKTEIELSGVSKKEMTPQDIYIALDLFFSQPGMDVFHLEKKYRQAQPPLTWAQVVAYELAESNIAFNGDILERTGKAISSMADQTYNSAVHYKDKAWDKGAEFVDKYGAKGILGVSGGLFGFYYGGLIGSVPGAIAGTLIGAGASKLYHYFWGADAPSQEKTAAFINESIKMPVGTNQEIEALVRKYFPKEHAEEFVKLSKTEKQPANFDREQNVQYQVAGESLYMLSEFKIEDLKSNPGLAETGGKMAAKNIMDFVKKKVKNTQPDLEPFVLFSRPLYNFDKKTVQVFSYMPRPPLTEGDKGSKEFQKISIKNKTHKELANADPLTNKQTNTNSQ